MNCSPSSDGAKKKIVDGVEVIANAMSPNTVRGKRSRLVLHKEYVLDTERPDILEAGFGSASEIEVDPEGNIYITGFRNRDNFIYKFDRQGRFVASFGRAGQGPGELQWPMRLRITANRELAVSDAQIRKLVYYALDGTFQRELSFAKTDGMIAQPLDNGNFLIEGIVSFDRTVDYSISGISLYGPDLNKIRDLETYKYYWNDISKLSAFFQWRISGDMIYVINEERGYEINGYSLDGRLVRRIRKEYEAVPPSEEISRSILGPAYAKTGSKNKGYFPAAMPPLNRFYTDDEGRIFAMTYEKGEHPSEFLYDIFDPRGSFIDRIALPETGLGPITTGPQWAAIRNPYLYWLNRKEDSGYVEIIVYRMTWTCL